MKRLFKKLFGKEKQIDFMISEDEALAYFETWEAQQRKQKEEKVMIGVKSLREGRPVIISNLTGEGMELAFSIKKQLIFEETQKLNNRIKIEGMRDIKITFK